MKKPQIFYSFFIISLICIGVFFKPLFLSDKVGDNCRLSIVLNEFEVRSGEPYFNSVDYQSVTGEQVNAILDLMKQYPYQRTIYTPFSDGSLSDMGDKVLYVYSYDSSLSANTFLLSSSGKIVVNNKNYRMKNAERFIEQVIEVLQ